MAVTDSLRISRSIQTTLNELDLEALLLFRETLRGNACEVDFNKLMVLKDRSPMQLKC